MQAELSLAVKTAAKKLFDVDVEPEFSRPDEQFGDYSTNVAMQLAAETGKNPREIAQQLAEAIDSPALEDKPAVAGPGFINFKLNDETLLEALNNDPAKIHQGQVMVVEYSDPNPFKELHIGHLYDGILGESIAKLMEATGAKVHRVNFGGDVGLHVAKTMWAILRQLGGEKPEGLNGIAKSEHANWLSQRYVEGNQAYEDDPKAKNQIIELNQRVYELHDSGDKESAFAKIYWTTRKWSYDYFDDFYKRIGTKFEKYYPESETAPIGLKVVREQLQNGIFTESDGAVIFAGETHSLHTRVFINSKGLPTYETKDIGLALAKWRDYRFDRTVISTGSEIIEYMKVVLAALSQFEPEIAARTTHLPHGMVKMRGAAKMSSRKGNVIRAVDVLDMTAEAAAKAREGKVDEIVTLAAIKYAFLKQRHNADIIFDPAESVSLEGNSGPYLQYAYVRAKKILQKIGDKKHVTGNNDLEPGERSLVRKLSEYPEVVEAAARELLPSHLATYLYELAQNFNRFYEKNRVVGSDREVLRLKLVEDYSNVLKSGLEILNIQVPERM